MASKHFIGGPLDGYEDHAITPQGRGDHMHIYFGQRKEGDWILYYSDTPYFKPRVIARYNCDTSVDPSRYYFKRMEWIDR